MKSRNATFFENVLHTKCLVKKGYKKRSLDAITNESYNTSGYIFIPWRWCYILEIFQTNMYSTIQNENLNLQLQIRLEKKQNSFKFFWKIFSTDLNRCLQYVYIMIARQLLEGHEILCIMVRLDIYDRNIIQSNNYSLVELSQLTLLGQKIILRVHLRNA